MKFIQTLAAKSLIISSVSRSSDSPVNHRQGRKRQSTNDDEIRHWVQP